MPIYLMLTRTTELAQIELREALSELWPQLEWLRAPALLATGEYLGVFHAPRGCTTGQVRGVLRQHRIRASLLWPAPAGLSIPDVVEAREQRPETD